VVARKRAVFAYIKTHLPHRDRAGRPKARHAKAGGTRSRAINDRISANICRDTATLAI
jgi:hypothetical protein